MKSFFRPKKFEMYKNRPIYEYIGIKWFKKYLITDGDLIRRWRKIDSIRTKKENLIKDLYKAEHETKKYEIIHLFFLFICFVLIMLKHDNLSLADWLIIIFINMYANIYPIFLQRYNRIRIIRLLMKIDYKTAYVFS